MAKTFKSFVLFAEMRTGSNHLEESLNAFPDLACLGEVFNSAFVGHHNKFELYGVTQDQRDADPLPLLGRIVEKAEGLPGFRFFHDHDPRVVEAILPDPTVAKIILTRNPLDSYVSLKIAAQTGQWRLTNMKNQLSAKVTFKGAEFDEMLGKIQGFQEKIHRVLQTTGQTAFYMNYEQISDLEVINGLARFLGSEHQLDALPGRLKKQNPGGLDSKLTNYDEMQKHLEGRDPFGLEKTPNFEPPRGPMVPGYVGAATSPLLFLPIKGAPEASVLGWLNVLDGEMPVTGFSQKTLRQWMRHAPGFLSFSVLRHPLERAYHSFNAYILPPDVEAYQDLRRVMIRRLGLPIPEKGVVDGYGPEEHETAFRAFLSILKGTLNGQTNLRIDPAWASQAAILQGVTQVLQPQRLIPEHRLAEEMAQMADVLGLPQVEAPIEVDAAPFPLAAIHSKGLEDIAMDTYRKDYLAFGYKRWGRG